MKTKFIRFIIFLFLLVVVELCLRFAGHKPGVLSNEMYPVSEMISEPFFKADSLGITSYHKNSPGLPIGYEINNQGFRSPINFNKKTIDSLRVAKNQEVVFLVGDSYTEGCCAFPINNSFADKLYQDQQNISLNFGIGGTDLIQYKLVTEHYVKTLSPDVVVVLFYLGNDILYYKRPSKPYVPLFHRIKDYKWLNAYPYLLYGSSKEFLESPQEAYLFYLNKYTLWGEEATFFEKIVRKSVLCSKLYLGVRELSYKIKRQSDQNEQKVTHTTNTVLKEIHRTCMSNNSKMIVIGIPSPSDVASQVDLEKKYGKYFEDVPHVFPNISIFTPKHYDGLEDKNHFNISGHQKFYEFMSNFLQEKLYDK